MAEVRVQMGGSERVVVCDDGEEAHIEALAKDFDGRVAATKAQHKGITDEQAVLIAALALLDELNTAKAAKPEGKAAEWAADQLDRASERLEKVLGKSLGKPASE